MRVVLLVRALLGTALVFSLTGCVAPQPQELVIPTLDPLPPDTAAVPEPPAATSTPAKKPKPEKKAVVPPATTTAATTTTASPAKKTKPEKKTAPPSILVATTAQPVSPASTPKPPKKSAPIPKVAPTPVVIAPKIQPPTIQPVPARQPAPAVSTPPPAADEADTGSGFDNLEFADVSVKAKLNILRVGSDLGANNLLTVFAGLKNKTAHRLDLEMQTVYKDKAGNELNHGSWIPVTLKPHEEKEYRSSAISTEASDFVVRIRNASDQGTQ